MHWGCNSHVTQLVLVIFILLCWMNILTVNLFVDHLVVKQFSRECCLNLHITIGREIVLVTNVLLIVFGGCWISAQLEAFCTNCGWVRSSTALGRINCFQRSDPKEDGPLAQGLLSYESTGWEWELQCIIIRSLWVQL